MRNYRIITRHEVNGPVPVPRVVVFLQPWVLRLPVSDLLKTALLEGHDWWNWWDFGIVTNSAETAAAPQGSVLPHVARGALSRCLCVTPV